MSYPNLCCDQFQSGEEVLGVFLIARRDGAKVFDFVEEALDEVSLAVQGLVEMVRGYAVGLGRDVGPEPVPQRGFAQGVAVIGSVRQQNAVAVQRGEKVFDGGAVMALPGGQEKVDRIAAGVDQGVDLRRQTAPGTSHAAIVEAPFFALAPC